MLLSPQSPPFNPLSRMNGFRRAKCALKQNAIKNLWQLPKRNGERHRSHRMCGQSFRKACDLNKLSYKLEPALKPIRID